MSEARIPSESEDKLREAIRLLEEAVQRGEGLPEASRQKLADLLSEAQGVLGGGAGTSPDDHAGMSRKLREELAAFEGSHPDVAYLLAQIMETLSGLGI